MADRDLKWMFPLIGTSQDKRASRLAVRPPGSYQLRGVDGRDEGELRPFPGFKRVYNFDPTGAESSSSGGSGTDWGGSTWNNGYITDVRPIEFLLGENGYGYGFIYRVTDSTLSLSKVLCDYWSSISETWRKNIEVISSSAQLPPTFGGTKQLDVAVWGRLIYVFLEGQEPVLLYSTDATSTLTLQEDTGPGLQPWLTSYSKSAALGAVGVPLLEDRPGVGQLVLIDFKPSEVGLGLGDGSSSSSGRSGQQDKDTTRLEPGDYAFAYMLYSSTTGRRSALSKPAHVRLTDFQPIVSQGTGASSSGMSSGASSALTTSSTSYVYGDAVNLYAAIEIVYDSSKYDQAYIYRSVKTQDAGGTFVAGILHLDRIIDLEQFHTVNNGSPPFDDVSGAGQYRQAIYWYELADTQLPFQDVFLDYSQFDANMPYGGSALWYDGTLLVGKLRGSSVSVLDENRKDDVFRGTGEIRWSSLVELGPEMFPPSNRYVPSLANNDVLAFHQLGPNVIGWSRDKQYIIRKEENYLRTLEIHSGFGITNQRAVDVVGNAAYFVNRTGMKVVDAGGQLDAVRNMDRIIQRTWKDSLDRVNVSFDPAAGCLCVHNPVEEHAVFLWFQTGRITELTDMTFDEVVRSPWPTDFDRGDSTTFANPLQQQSLWLQNFVQTSGYGSFTPCLYAIDTNRESLQDSGSYAGQSRIAMRDHQGNGIFTVASVTSATVAVTLSGSEACGVSDDLHGAYLYVLWSATESLIGTKGKLAAAGTGGSFGLFNLATEDLGVFSGLAAGDIVGVAPVVFEWIGHPLGSQDEDQAYVNVSDFFRLKHVKSIAPAFANVVGSPTSESGKVRWYQGLIWKGDEDDPTQEVFCRDNDGTISNGIVSFEAQRYAAFGAATSPITGRFGLDGTSLTPGLRIICPDLDFRLIGVMVTGSLRDSYRSERGST